MSSRRGSLGCIMCGSVSRARVFGGPQVNMRSGPQGLRLGRFFRMLAGRVRGEGEGGGSSPERTNRLHELRKHAGSVIATRDGLMAAAQFLGDSYMVTERHYASLLSPIRSIK